MICSHCGDEYIGKRGYYEFNDPLIGKYGVNNAFWRECPNCRKRLLPAELSRNIDKEYQRIINNLINQYPMSDFISTSETAEILGISRQALHKHRRIQRGFIYQTTFNGKKIFLRKSVLLFKKNGDGRYPLREQITEQTSPTNYIYVTLNIEPIACYLQRRAATHLPQGIMSSISGQTLNYPGICYERN